jgi:hypothetical protein
MIGLAVVACSMMAVFASPSFAKKEKVFFGHFTSSINGKTISPTSPATAKGKGEVDELKVGPLSMECVTKSGFTLAATALVEAERSSNLTSTVKITGCKTDIKFGKGGNFTPAKVNFGKGIKMEFHANGSVAVGNPNPPGGEVKILETAPVEVKVAGQKCKLFIPAQSLPLASEKNPEKEYEAAEYASETEAVEGAKLKKYPSGFKETLDISWELKGIKSYVPVEPGRCEYQKGEEGAYAPAEGELPNRVVYGGGKFEGEIEEMEVKGGNLGFDPTPSEN